MKKRALQSQATLVRPSDDFGAIPVAKPIGRQVPLGPAEAFVLSYVDGRRSVVDIAGLVALSPTETSSVCQRLAALDAIELRPGQASSSEVEVDLDGVDEGWDGPPATERRR